MSTTCQLHARIPGSSKASIPSSNCWHIRIRWCLTAIFFFLTSSLRSSRCMSQVTVACGERGIHSRKVLLFSVAYTVLSSVTSTSSGRNRDRERDRKSAAALKRRRTPVMSQSCQYYAWRGFNPLFFSALNDVPRHAFLNQNLFNAQCIIHNVRAQMHAIFC